MGSNGLIFGLAFKLFIFALGAAVLTVFAVIQVIGILAISPSISGFIAFRPPPGKIASIGGVLILLAIQFLRSEARTASR